MKIEKIILKKGEKKPKNCGLCTIRQDVSKHPCRCLITGKPLSSNFIFHSVHPDCPIVEQPAITDPESLDNTLSQHEELEGYEFVQGVGDCDDCAKCDINGIREYRIESCPNSCEHQKGYYKRKTE